MQACLLAFGYSLFWAWASPRFLNKCGLVKGTGCRVSGFRALGVRGMEGLEQVCLLDSMVSVSVGIAEQCHREPFRSLCRLLVVRMQMNTRKTEASEQAYCLCDAEIHRQSLAACMVALSLSFIDSCPLSLMKLRPFVD